MSWIYFALFGFLVDATATVIDKGLLGTRKVHALSYAYFTGITSIGVALVFPLLHWVAILLEGRGIVWRIMLDFRFELLPLPLLLEALLSGMLFLGGLYFFYRSLEESEPVRAVPLVYGVVTPILTLVFAWIIAGDVLTANELIAFGLFGVGGLMLMIDRHKGFSAINTSLARHVIFAGIFLAASFALTRALYTATDQFLLAFVWARLGSVLGGLALLAIPSGKSDVPLSQAHKKLGAGTWTVLLSNKVLGAIGFLSFNIALSAGPAALVNALAGTKYFFVFMITLILPTRFRSLVISNGSPFAQKIFGVTLVSIGVYILYWFSG